MKGSHDVAKAMQILRALFGLALLVVFLSSISCASRALSIRSTEGNVEVFELGQRIPRNVKILDILDTSGPRKYTSQGLAIYGGRGSCRYRPVIGYLKKEAKARGGDAIAILHVRKPLMWDRCFKIKAFLLDLTHIGDWPRIPLTEEEITLYLSARGQMLDDIEGIWASQACSEVMMDDDALRVAKVYEYSPKGGDPTGASIWRAPPSVIQAMEQLSPEQQSSYQVAIVKADGDPDYPYAAYILDPDIPEWKPGFLKARLRKLPDSSGYEAKWYGSTFQAGLRQFHPDETGALTTKVVIEQGLKYSIEQTLTKVYPAQRQ